ncbi:MAG: ABC transporter ATP-binding protein [Pseudobdellovibrionaceae bacterium]|nr:ABC transporter ATP-binding protein [Pseudobdellovibrionaceae bacterium]
MAVWIEVNNVTKSFPVGFWMRAREVIHQASFALEENRSVGFVGPNGSGKTTLMKLMLNFIFPDSGEIRYPSCDNNFSIFRSQLGFMPERPFLYDFLSAREFLYFHWVLGGGTGSFKKRMDEILKKVRLSGEENTRLRHFSKGMLQRIGLGQALLHRPKYLILDEPMSGLDPDGRYEMRVILKEQKDAGSTILLSSHLIEDVEYICDDVLLIMEGRIVYFGAISDLKKNMQEDDLYSIISRLKVGGRK